LFLDRHFQTHVKFADNYAVRTGSLAQIPPLNYDKCISKQ